MGSEIRKLAVVFPGIGYHTDLPLLYYARKLAAARGYAVREVHYRGFPRRVGDWCDKTIHDTTKLALEQANELLYHMNYEELDSLLFIGKSIGTAVAAAYAKEHDIDPKLVLYTPIDETFRYPIKNAIVFHGTNDRYADTKKIEAACKKASVPLFLSEGASHSLETSTPEEDLATLLNVMKETARFMDS